MELRYYREEIKRAAEKQWDKEIKNTILMLLPDWAMLLEKLKKRQGFYAEIDMLSQGQSFLNVIHGSLKRRENLLAQLPKTAGVCREILSPQSIKETEREIKNRFNRNT